MTETTTDYRPMWEALGLDLPAHDALLGAIPLLYENAYLSQANRPQGMAYFDFVMGEIHGLRIKELVDHKAAGMIDAITDKYLDINCACFTPNSARIDDVIRLAKEYRADGIVQYDLQFCAPYQIESTLVTRAAQVAGIPVLRIDTDYSAGDIGQLSTRVEAFLEMIAG